MDTTIFRGVELQTVPQQIANAIKEVIYEGKLQPGESVAKQEELAQTFGVSRPTIREALKILNREQVIMPNPNKESGYVIANFHPDNAMTNVRDTIILSLTFQTMTLLDLFHVRQMLEIPCAGLAAERRTAKDLERLREYLPMIDLESRSTREIIELDLSFHLILAESTHNPLAIMLIRALTTAYMRFIPELQRVDKASIVADLPEVFEAIEDQDVERAKLQMQHHMSNFVNFYDAHERSFTHVHHP
ncbi:FadR/GntR family transcriptional regulator [Paenibacillus daejeonensis]|uniref:FadR/GntR family transcriptional regulator n=1 Tax=Paenibacillus daejeonensis TaxID=135193 RepID=UPI00037F2489|nr:FCD domain-containing protein [Paenibacillus daejeonensis]